MVKVLVSLLVIAVLALAGFTWVLFLGESFVQGWRVLRA